MFVVFARTPTDTITAVAVDAATPGITRHLQHPSGLSGWSWGRLDLDAVAVASDDVLGGSGGGSSVDGLAIFDEHFAHYRPLVTATALGAAGAVHDTVAAHLADRERRGEINRVRDHALITLGRAHAQIGSGLLAALHSQRLAATSHPHASLWGRTTKALGVDLARDAADHLAVLVGAAGFTADHHLQKARHDLDALRYADGIHDSLNRSAGRVLLADAPCLPAADLPGLTEQDTNADDRPTPAEHHHAG